MIDRPSSSSTEATGDLAKRMVLAGLLRPVPPRPAARPLEARRQRSRRRRPRGLPGSHPRRPHRVRRAPDPAEWDGFAANVLFAGGGFRHDDPGSLLDVIERRPRRTGDDGAAHPLPGHPADHVRADDRGDQGARSQHRRRRSSTRSRTARRRRASRNSTRWCTPCSTRSRSTGSTTSSVRKRPRTCTCCGSPTDCSATRGTTTTSSEVQIDVPGDAGHRRSGRVLRRDRRRPRHARHPSVPGGRRSGDGAADLVRRRGSADRAGVGDRRVPAARPRRGRARAVRELPGDRRHRRRLHHRHVRRRPALDRHRPLAAACRSCCGPARRWPPVPSGSASSSGRRTDRCTRPGGTPECSLRPVRQRCDRDRR